jgi:outer membrane protein OmpA-like peptidoglycan-associated protein
MRHLMSITIAMFASLVACGGGSARPSVMQTPASKPQAPAQTQDSAASGGSAADAPETAGAASDEFVIRKSEKTKEDQTRPASKIKPTRTEAALKFTVIDKDKGPIEGIIVALTASDGKKYYTEETSADGYAELLVPIGQSYELVYLGLGRRDMAAKVTVTNEPNQNLRLTLRYKRYEPPASAATPASEPRFVLEGVTFDSGKTTIREDSYARLDSVVEYMTHKKSAQIEISGHTDNAGNPKANKLLSEKRAQACRDYLTSKGIDASRIRAVGYGDERPIAPNDTEDGRKQNRRIEATEL